ncbi:MAG: penicillin acylase family protein [Ginsengibacter sp.]
MKNFIIILIIFPLQLLAQDFTKQEIQRWNNEAKNVTIIRDNWGIPHIYGKTDADAVFGLLYAQCEDDFQRVEMNYIEKLGRMAEVKGQNALYSDLLIRLIIDSADAVADYKKSPPWLHKLLDAFADGINFYLYKNPGTKTALLHRFKPWYPLLWTDGSIGAISTGGVSEDELKAFYTGSGTTYSGATKKNEEQLSGSNGFAFSPSITASHNSILYINPHVTFYFRPEVHVVSEEGLNAYGAVTWGQFFVYQGFNEHCGWMHTSSDVDVADMYAEKVFKKNNSFFYKYNNTEKPVTEKIISLNYTSGSETISKNITTYFTHHGPVMAKRNGQWITVKSNNRSMTGLIQSWQRTKAKSFLEYKKVMNLLANTSNNTVYADAEGNIAYWHGNFIPKRNPSLDWSKPVDGSIKATEWKGLHTVDESVHIYNPPNGWIQNCNSTPFTAAGEYSPDRKRYPIYMAPDGENYRGINAVRVLSKEKSYTIDKVITAGYDTYLAAFEKLLPALISSFEKNVNTNDTLYTQLNEPIDILKSWNLRCGENSIATTLAVEWGQKLIPKMIQSVDEDEYQYVDQVTRTNNFIKNVKAGDLLQPLLEVVDELNHKFGDWRVPWGSINRFQRISGDLDLKYSDEQPSIPVGFASSAWGMLPSYASTYFPGTKKRYGVGGNSFVCAVEFGKRVKAKSLLAGGESGKPGSAHFSDQAIMYASGTFKDVLFYKEDVLKHTERTYHPGSDK